jgi:hypothetical protein
MKKVFLAGIAALSMLTAASAADESEPRPPRFQPWQAIWQCNDIRVTVTARHRIRLNTKAHPVAGDVSERTLPNQAAPLYGIFHSWSESHFSL